MSEFDSNISRPPIDKCPRDLAKIKHLFYTISMDVFEKIKLTALNTPFEAAEDIRRPNLATACPVELEQLKAHFPVTHAHLPNGQTIPLLKTMQTSACEKDCYYCCFRAGRNTPRASLTPDELAAAVVKLTRAGIAKGLFLSSGLAGGAVRVQDRADRHS
jgi:predicted DNA-binding helix-hairpin-helix protein